MRRASVVMVEIERSGDLTCFFLDFVQVIPDKTVMTLKTTALAMCAVQRPS